MMQAMVSVFENIGLLLCEEDSVKSYPALPLF